MIIQAIKQENKTITLKEGVGHGNYVEINYKITDEWLQKINKHLKYCKQYSDTDVILTYENFKEKFGEFIKRYFTVILDTAKSDASTLQDKEYIENVKIDTIEDDDFWI